MSAVLLAVGLIACAGSPDQDVAADAGAGDASGEVEDSVAAPDGELGDSTTSFADHGGRSPADAASELDAAAAPDTQAVEDVAAPNDGLFADGATPADGSAGDVATPADADAAAGQSDAADVAGLTDTSSPGSCAADSDCAAAFGALLPCELAVCDPVKKVCTKVDKIGACCADQQCDDGDPCTKEACSADNWCVYDVQDPTCCAVVKVGAKAVVSEDFESAPINGLPLGWQAKCMLGTPALPGQQYTCSVKWHVSTQQAKSGPAGAPPQLKSVNFSGPSGPINVVGKTPAGVLESPAFLLPAVGTSYLSFDLLLLTQCGTPPGCGFPPPPPFPIDLTYVQIVDLAAQEANPYAGVFKIWDSNAINGTTKGVWRLVLIKLDAKFAGKALMLRIAYDAGSSGVTQFAGPFVDNVQVQTLCGDPACLADKDCQPAGNPDPCKDHFCGVDAVLGIACKSKPKSPLPAGC